MKIDYEVILEKANVRTKQLKEFQEYATIADEQAQNLLGALQYFSTIGNMARALDNEAQMLVLPAVQRAIRIGGHAASAYRLLTTSDSMGSDANVLMSLVDEIA